MKNGPAVSSCPLSHILLSPRFCFLICHSPHFISLCFQNSSLHQFNPSSLFFSFLSSWLLPFRAKTDGEGEPALRPQAAHAGGTSPHFVMTSHCKDETIAAKVSGEAAQGKKKNNNKGGKERESESNHKAEVRIVCLRAALRY